MYNLALIDTNLLLEGEYPILIDEWQLVLIIWDYIRRKCDEDKTNGKFILTGSTMEKEGVISHSGAGRICKLEMNTMSLYETGESDGKISLNDLFDNIDIQSIITKEYTLEAQIIIKSYIQDILNNDINEIDDKKRDRNKMFMLLKSLARNESTIVSNETIIKDILENEFNTINKETEC